MLGWKVVYEVLLHFLLFILRQMSFLPTDYEVPATESRFPKFSEWENKFRVIGGSKVWRQWFNVNDKKHITKNKDDVPMDEVKEWRFWKSIQHFRAFPVWDYQTKSVWILTITQKTLQRAFELTLKDEDYKDPKEYDIKITQTKNWDKTEYGFLPGKHKDLPDEILAEMLKVKVDMDAYFECKPVDDIFELTDEKF